MKKRVFIIHGWEGYPTKDWMPWLKRELEERECEVIVPAMPNTMHPELYSWFSHLQKVIKNPNQNTFFAGHSLGCIAILRYLESLKKNERVGGVVLVAGFGHDLEYEGYKGELSSFFKTPIDWQKIKNHCSRFIAIHSKDDPWVPIEHNAIYKDKLGAESIIVKDMGHFNMNELPLALEQVLRISNL